MDENKNRVRVLNVRDVSNMTKLSIHTLNRYRTKKYRIRGIGPPFRRIGQRKIGYLEHDVIAWMNKLNDQ